MKKYQKILLGVLLFCIPAIVIASPVTPGSGGGTGLSTSTSANDGGCLIQSSSTPSLRWRIGTCPGGSASGTIFYANGSLFVTSSTINFQAGSNITISTSSNGTYTITGVAASGTFTTITGVSPIVITQVGANATATCPTCIATNTGSWAGLWQGVNSTTFYLASNPSGYTNNTGTVFSFVAGNGITLTPSPIISSGTIQLNTSTVNALITAFGYITSSTGNTIYLQIANNLSDLTSTSSARTTLGIKATSSLALADSNGIQTSFAGSTCSSGVMIGHSASGTAICTATSTNPGTVTTSSAGTTNSIPLWTSASALGNSSLSQSAGTTLINGVTPILDGGGNYIGGNVLLSGNSVIAQNVTGTTAVGNFVQGGGVSTFSTSTGLTGAQFCAGGYFNIMGTTATATITLPDFTTMRASTCGATAYSSNFTSQFLRNNSNFNVTQNTSGTGEEIDYSPGTPSVLAPGQTWFIQGQFTNSSTQLISNASTSFQVNVSLYQTSTPLVFNGNTITVSGILQDAQGNKYSTSTTSSGGSGAGNLFVSPTSTVIANNVVKFQTAGSSTVAQTSSIYSFSSGNNAVGTSTENGILNVVNSSGIPVLRISTSTLTTSSVSLAVLGASSTAISNVSVFQILGDGHLNSTGTVPVLSSCGTSPSIVGTDAWGQVTVGSVSATSCTVTFNIPYEATPSCVVTSQTAAIAVGYSITTTALTVTNAALTSDKFNYWCGLNL